MASVPVESPPFPFEAAAERRARLALAEAIREEEARRKVLYGAMGDCVRHLKEQGMTPEAALITMKAFIRHSSETPPDAVMARPLVEEVIAWCINEYYRV